MISFCFIVLICALIYFSPKMKRYGLSDSGDSDKGIEVSVLIIFNKLFSIKKHNKQEVVTAFSGLLELSRRHKVETIQENLFDDITVKRAQKHS